MAAQINQDFVTFAGDDVYPIFTVYDAAGAVVDISTVSQIVWSAVRSVGDTPAASASKTGGTIAFVTNGTDGKFQVTVGKAATSLMMGFYLHTAAITDAIGNVTTVSVGRMMVGAKPAWTYDPSTIASNTLFQVRRLIGDVLADDPQIWDEEIAFFLTLRSNVYGAAAEACRSIAAQYSRKVNTTSPGSISTEYGVQAEHYLTMARQMEQRSKLSGAGSLPYAGGMSISDKRNISLNTDRVQPSFNIGMTDNLFMPVAPIGNEVPQSPPGPSTQGGAAS